jgi:hypothetical protein
MKDSPMEVVINSCFGGFSLSDAAIRRYAELKGLNLYPEQSKYGFSTYWTVPKEERVKELPGNWHDHSVEKRREYNRKHSEQVLYDRDIARDDPLLVQVVRELGDEANGRCAELRIIEIPDDVDWEIDEYDGNEHITEKHRTWP